MNVTDEMMRAFVDAANPMIHPLPPPRVVREALAAAIALLPSAADGELPPMPTMPFLGYDPDGGDLHGYSHGDMEAYARAAIAASRPSAADEPVAYIMDPGAGSGMDKLIFARDRDRYEADVKARGGSFEPLYRPASARPSAGAELREALALLSAEAEAADMLGYGWGPARERALAALSSVAPAAEGWQPIASAPKDGSTFLVFLPGERRTIQTAWRNENGVMAVGSCFAFDLSPATHWQPLPAAPSSAQPGVK